jgi:hypothetical protein
MQVPSSPSQPNTLTQPRSFGCGAFFMLGTAWPAPVARPYNCVATTTITAILQVCSKEEKMNITGNILIGFGMFGLIFGTSMGEPMETSAFLLQITCIIGGLCVAIIGGIVRIMAE